MGYTTVNGFTPDSVESIIDKFRVAINAEFATSYTTETFKGTKFYKFVYGLAQEINKNEITYAECFQKLQDYIIQTNAKINDQRTHRNGIVKYLASKNYLASLKPQTALEAGQVTVCVDVDDSDPDYATLKQQILDYLKDCVVGGIVCNGSETGTSVLTNGQSMPFAYDLPTKTDVYLKLTITLSKNTDIVAPADADIKALLLANIAERYSLGMDFEPERYFEVMADAPYASDILLEYSLDSGSTWDSVVYESLFTDFWQFDILNVSLVFI